MQQFRVGRKAKRTLYLQAGDEASNNDRIVGLVDTPELARFLAEAANQRLESDPDANSLIQSLLA